MIHEQYNSHNPPRYAHLHCFLLIISSYKSEESPGYRQGGLTVHVNLRHAFSPPPAAMLLHGSGRCCWASLPAMPAVL